MINSDGIGFAFQPMVRVGLVEEGGFGLRLEGRYDINAGDDFVSYVPMSEDSYVVVDNVEIGKGFHWNRKQQQMFKGILMIRKPDEGKSMLINVLPVEKYLLSVISSEMNPESHIEFLKAHAVISRSWVMRMLSKKNKSFTDDRCSENSRVIDWTDNEKHILFDVCADDHCQRYQGIGFVNENAEKAVVETCGLVLTDAYGEICDTRFSKCCGGKTELFSSCWQPINFHYLQPVDDCFCNPSLFSDTEKLKIKTSILKGYDSETADFYRWTVDIKKEKIAENLKKYFGKSVGLVCDLQIVKRGSSGRIVELNVIGTERNIIVGKELAIRKLLSDTHLYSSDFEIENHDSYFRLTGKGWGHGVGLCQIGAAIMAERGYTCEEILQYYYKGSKLTKLYEK